MTKIKRFFKKNKLKEMARTNIDIQGKISIHTYGEEFEKEPHFHFIYKDKYKASLTIKELKLISYRGFTKQYRQKVISKEHLLIVIKHLKSQHRKYNCTNWEFHIDNWNICNSELPQVKYKMPNYQN